MLRSLKTIALGSLVIAMFYSSSDFNQVSARVPDSRGGRSNDGMMNSQGNMNRGGRYNYMQDGGRRGDGRYSDGSRNYNNDNASDYPYNGGDDNQYGNWNNPSTYTNYMQQLQDRASQYLPYGQRGNMNQNDQSNQQMDQSNQPMDQNDNNPSDDTQQSE